MASNRKKVFFDANVIFAMIFPKRSGRTGAEKAYRVAPSVVVSALTVQLAVYFGAKDHDFSPADIRSALKGVEVLDLTATDTEWAFNNMRNNDYEDALQLAVAVRNGCDVFATFDKSLYNTYKSLPIIKLELLK